MLIVVPIPSAVGVATAGDNSEPTIAAHSGLARSQSPTEGNPPVALAHHRPDLKLKQCILDLIVSSDGDLPLFLRGASGNESDKAVFAHIKSGVFQTNRF